MWWLVYRHFARIQFVIIEAESLVQARMAASGLGLDAGGTFQEGHEIRAPRSKRVPKELIGKVLNREEAAAVLRTMEG
jgi:hypothetical protein